MPRRILIVRHGACAVITLMMAGAACCGQVDIIGPPGSGVFGSQVTALPNGNFVVTDPEFDAPGPISNVGAVHLYRADGRLISSLRGSTAEDRVGELAIVVVGNGHFVVASPAWDNGTIVNAGAVTWIDGVNGLNGVVDDSNSLVGSEDDFVGVDGVVALDNGHYLVVSPYWDNGSANDAGAVTWGNGNTGIVGVVNAGNSLVGSSVADMIGNNGEQGNGGVWPLRNGHYVVISDSWNNGTIGNAGAVTWGNGAAGVRGEVSAGNSLVGASGNDFVGGGGVVPLVNGHYVVLSPQLDRNGEGNVGAVSWGNGDTGSAGVVSISNALVGSVFNDRVGNGGVTALSNGNYVVVSPDCANGAIAATGAATWGNGNSGVSGAVSTANSLMGSVDIDRIGGAGVTALSNGHYVVASPEWDNAGIQNVGAATWGNGASGTTGAVSALNSLVGTTMLDRIGSGGVTALSNGHYVVVSQNWSNAPVDRVGAVTWGNGNTGIIGAVTTVNSLAGSTELDRVGNFGVTALRNGHYVVTSADWNNNGITLAGAVTWGNGQTGVSGLVSGSNSLVGTRPQDRVGFRGVVEVGNGNYVVASSAWKNADLLQVGAITWADGAIGIRGAITPGNSLIGSDFDQRVGLEGVTALSNGHYVIRSQWWRNAAGLDVGAVTWGDGNVATSGIVSASNSLVGNTAFDWVGFRGVKALADGGYVVEIPDYNDGAISLVGAIALGQADGSTIGAVSTANSVIGRVAWGGHTLVHDYDPIHRRLLVGQPRSNIVTLLRVDELMFDNGFE